MIKIPNYNVVVPTTPDLNLTGKKRTDPNGDRGELTYSFTADSVTYVELPWQPTASEWIEVYINGVRLINPRITSDLGGSLFEVYNNIGNNTLRFSTPISGEVTILCDTKATHWQGSVIVDPKNVQTEYIYKELYDFVFTEWPVTGGTGRGFTYRVNYEVGPKFEPNTYVLVEGCSPSFFNGNYKVLNSSYGSVTYRGNVVVAPGTRMNSLGTVSGIGNGVVKTSNIGVALYSEPIILTQPYNGYARLTTDRKSIAYTPNLNYVGNDTFSWSMINQRGQIGTPKCVYINISA